MVGGMITAPLLSLFVLPALYLLWRKRGLGRERAADRMPVDVATS